MSRQHAIVFACLGALIGLSGCTSLPVTPAAETPDLASILQSAANAETSVVAVTAPAPCCERQTLPDFLGITDACNFAIGSCNNVRNLLGTVFPGLEARPPVLAITDPANLAADAPPAVKAAAEIKAQEDAAAQKIKALRYLATIGCGGCYPDVEEALIAAMDDCTEEVRYEAVLAVRDTTGTECCFCSCEACCSEKVQNKLRELAYEKKGCCGEPSARVRRQARLALAECGPPVVFEELEAPVEAPPTEGPVEGPEPPIDNGAEAADTITTILPTTPGRPVALPTRGVTALEQRQFFGRPPVRP